MPFCILLRIISCLGRFLGVFIIAFSIDTLFNHNGNGLALQEELKRKADEIGNALKPRVITPSVGGIEQEPVVPQFIIDILAKVCLQRKALSEIVLVINLLMGLSL